MSNKKGLLFYYDWLDQLLKLKDDELRVVLSAIVLYHKEDVYPPPQLSGMADMALGFILPQIDRMKKKSEDGKLGGRPRKEETELSARNEESKSAAPVYNNKEKNLCGNDETLATLVKKKRIEEGYERRHRQDGDWAFSPLAK